MNKPIQMNGLKKSNDSLTDLAQELKPSQHPSQENEREALTKITGISEESGNKTNRLTNDQKRYIRIQKDLEEQLISISVALSAFPATRKDAVVVALRTTATSDDIMSIAKKDERFCNILERYLSYGGYASLFSGLAMTALMICANHDIYPLTLFGMKKPEKPAKEQEEEEFTEEQRAMLFASLINRQQQMEAEYNGGNN